MIHIIVSRSKIGEEHFYSGSIPVKHLKLIDNTNNTSSLSNNVIFVLNHNPLFQPYLFNDFEIDFDIQNFCGKISFNPQDVVKNISLDYSSMSDDDFIPIVFVKGFNHDEK